MIPARLPGSLTDRPPVGEVPLLVTLEALGMVVLYLNDWFYSLTDVCFLEAKMIFISHYHITCSGKVAAFCSCHQIVVE